MSWSNAAFWNDKASLEIFVSIYQHEQFAVSEKSEDLLRIACTFGNVHPENVNGRAELTDLKTGPRVRDRVTTVRADDQIGQKIAFAVRRFCAHAGDPILVEKKIDHFMLHLQSKRRKSFCFGGKKIQEIPLRHESDKFAVRRQTGKIGHPGRMAVEDPFKRGTS